MSLSEQLKRIGDQSESVRRDRAATPTGFEPGVKYEADGSRLVTTPAMTEVLDDESAWRDAVESLGVSVPDGWRVRLVEMRFDPAAWHRDKDGDGTAYTSPVWRYRFAVEQNPHALADLDLDDLFSSVRRRKSVKSASCVDDVAFVVAFSDMQIGKKDQQGGIDVIVEKVLTSTSLAVDQLKHLRKMNIKPKTVVLAYLGDCIEGFVSQNGRLAWRTDLTLTEMLRVYRRLVLHAIDEFLPYCENMLVAAVPGNHGETIRTPVTTRADDSFDTDAVSAVADACALNVERYGKVSFVFPRDDEMTVTLDVNGTIMTLAHGHQFRRGDAISWWSGQATGMTSAGDSTLLLAGHLHHLKIETAGPRTFIQAPALDSGSAWFKEATGLAAPSGLVTLIVGRGSWDHLRVVTA